MIPQFGYDELHHAGSSSIPADDVRLPAALFRSWLGRPWACTFQTICCYRPQSADPVLSGVVIGMKC